MNLQMKNANAILIHSSAEHKSILYIYLTNPFSINVLSQCTVSFLHFLISESLLFRSLSQTPNLRNRLPSSLTHNRTSILHKCDLPHTFSRFIQFPHIIPSLGFVQPHSSVISTCHQKVLVKLERDNGRIVCCNAMEGCISFERKRDHPSVGTTCSEDGGWKLELADQGGMALKKS